MTPAAAQPRRIVYIAGYGRSGSTLLGRLLAEDDCVLDLGEVGGATRKSGKGTWRCTCGQPISECRVWGQVPQHLLSRRRRYADAATHSALLRAAGETADGGILVDSSKTAGPLALRPFYLNRNLEMPLTLVHLVRDPRAVLWSILRSRGRRKRPSPVWLQVALALKLSAGWALANCAADLFRLSHRSRSVLIRYDEALRYGVPETLRDLVPAGSLEGRVLSSRTGNHHAFAGNRLRKRESVVVALDRDWRDSLPRGLAALVVICCLPLMIRYGLLSGDKRDVEPVAGEATRRNTT